MVENYLDVYLRIPDLPKDDIAKALVARGRARKGAEQKLLLMASQGPSHSFIVLKTYSADGILSSHSFAALVDFQTASTFDPLNRELQFHLCQEPVVRPCALQYLKHDLQSPSL